MDKSRIQNKDQNDQAKEDQAVTNPCPESSSPEESIIRWEQRAKRFRARLQVELEFLHSLTTITTETVNFGKGGFIVSIPPGLTPTVGSLAGFKLNGANQEFQNIEGEAIVRWSSKGDDNLPAGIGLEFIVLNEESRKKVINLTASFKIGTPASQ